MCDRFVEGRKERKRGRKRGKENEFVNDIDRYNDYTGITKV